MQNPLRSVEVDGDDESQLQPAIFDRKIVIAQVSW